MMAEDEIVGGQMEMDGSPVILRKRYSRRQDNSCRVGPGNRNPGGSAESIEVFKLILPGVGGAGEMQVPCMQAMLRYVPYCAVCLSLLLLGLLGPLRTLTS